MITSIDLAGGQSTSDSAIGDVELRHSRYVIINPADDTGTLTLPANVSLTTGYEAQVFMNAYDTNFNALLPGVPVFSTNVPQVPLQLQLDPSTLAWQVFDPTVPGIVVPQSAFGIVYRCKIALKYWDNDATDLI
jgi:hypothetical protein